MSLPIRRAAVLGAGTMGAQIAAHFANAGLPCLLLDMTPADLAQERAAELQPADRAVRDRIVRQGLDRARQLKPAAFFTPETAGLITVGNFDDHLARLAECDWIVEAIVEDLAAKQALLARVDQVRRANAIVSSNTSGIPVAAVAEGRSAAFRRHWLGTHFFNPPRYLRLLEVIPTPETAPEVLAAVSDVADRVLGKGVVVAKDTPNFIANRIGLFGVVQIMRVMIEDGYTIEEIDELTGPAVGRPKSATFRTMDLAGIDVLGLVAANLRTRIPEEQGAFELPAFVGRMIASGWIGDKAGQGFYRRVRKPDGESEILTLDPATLEYRPRQQPKLPSLEAARAIEDPRERVRKLLAGRDRVAHFLRRTLVETLFYTAAHVPEIADRIVDIDRVMRWGFAWEHGPFELWDAIGVAETAAAREAAGQAVPPLVEALVASGHPTFYRQQGGSVAYFDLAARDWTAEPPRPGVILLKALKDRRPVLKRNPGASLVDLGDGILLVEFHSKMNAIGADTVQMLTAGVREAAKNFAGLVIGNDGANFSVGANLMLLLLEAQEENWDEIDLMVRAFQQADMALRGAPIPVVVAPFGLTLGGGCEVTLHGDVVRASAETYLGLVEAGVGLIPAGGGTKELLVRHLERVPAGGDLDVFPYVRRAFETIALAKVSTSAADAKALGYLRDHDGLTMNRERLIADAKETALDLARLGYQAPPPRAAIRVEGEPALATLKLGIHLALRAGQISEHDALIGRKLAWVLTGGTLLHPTTVDEQHLLDLEREAFLSLCGERKTQERIAHTLKTGKALRN